MFWLVYGVWNCYLKLLDAKDSARFVYRSQWVWRPWKTLFQDVHDYVMSRFVDKR